MEIRNILERDVARGKNFGPKELIALGATFDMAWKQIAPDIRQSPQATEAARSKLAKALLSVAQHGVGTNEVMCRKALALMFAEPTEI